ncbi:hypothetical protein UFOVP1302_71 [uncultured Caudovirales phage]|uniref:Large polyvalent protein associated domain-containing protein n=1 Tax=uncultured Caudovirales phage TaxID=2100421 RepID=A0A6J5RRX0_9CAUD|nr:hypothetical protein UFOVP895_74 [uncultured Caudovirales phage]CAB4181083.1 hypothetical protein UFOVP1070_13 [uncultured Caudovirales phage]CAB4196321.1 hypothetical protein UFOVP1302_71 [uncultured Caudovirales phage]CAB4211801.1 hypothetical protein UFOVP1416_41 [uncultured Caudovirales phage]
MSKLQDFRGAYPQYNDLSDEQLLTSLHQKLYSDMPFAAFSARMVDSTAPRDQSSAPQPSVMEPGSGSSLLSGAYGLRGNLYSALEGAGSLTGIESIERLGREGRISDEKAAEGALPESERMSFARAEGLRQNVRAAGQALGSSVPSMAPGIVGALGGAAIGSVVPVIGTGIGAILGSTAATIPQFFGANRQRQIQVSGGVQSELAALGTALPQAASEAIIDRFTLGLGRVLGLGGEAVARNIIPRIVRGVGLGAASEIPAEVFQQALERAQAGLDVLSPDAMAEYREAATAAAVVGGGMGGAFAGVGGRGPSPLASERPDLRGAIEGIVSGREPAGGDTGLPGAQGRQQADEAAVPGARFPVPPVRETAPERSVAQPELPVQPEDEAPAPQTPVVQPVEPTSQDGTERPAQTETFNIPVGKQFAVSTPDGSMKVDVVPEVVDLFSLTPASGGLQNRMINNPANQATISNIANAPDFTRLGTSPYSDRGAPIIGPDNVIEVGNHRVEGLKRGAENNPDAFQGYVRALSEAGYDTSGMQFPVLIRRRVSELSPEQRQDFTRLSNTEANQALSDLEMARQDAVRLTPELLSKFDGEVTGGIRAAKNLPFVRDFMAQVATPSERTRLVTTEGGVSDAFADRLERALFASAYNNIDLIKRAVESGDDDTKSITGGMIEATGAMQELRRGVEGGRIRPEFGIVDSLMAAADRVRTGKAKGFTPSDILATEDMITPIPPLEREIIKLLSNDNLTKIASKSAIGKRLKAFVEEAKKQTTDVDMVGGERRITPEEAVVAARNPGQASMFSAHRTGAAEEQTAPAAEEAAPNQDAARQIVNKYLAELRAMGRQGRLIANALEGLLKNGAMNANQIYQAFMIGETLAKTLPTKADYRIQFLQDIIVDNEQAGAASGAKVGDRAQGRVIYPTESLPGFIELSLAEDMLHLLRKTAAHEAFHVLQSYFSTYDTNFSDRINKFFKDDMKVSDLEPSIKRRLQGMTVPGQKISYYDVLVKGLGDRLLTAKEAQAYAFGALIDAANRGQKVTALTPSFQRFITFARDFLNRMKRGLTGDGFTAPADILTQAQQRGAAMGQVAPTTAGQSYSARRVPSEYAALSSGNVAGRQFSPAFTASTEKLTGKELDKPNVFSDAMRRFTGALPGEKLSSAFVRNTVNQAAPLWMMDRLAKEQGLSLKSAGIAMEVALNNRGRIEMYLEHGPPSYDPKTGDVKIREDVPGVLDAIKGRLKLEDKKEAQAYLVALRERDLRKSGKKGFFNLDDKEISSIISEAERVRPEWKQMAADIQRINNALIDFAVATGTLDRIKADQLRSMFYTPFYRQAEEDGKLNPDAAVGPRLSNSLTSVKGAFDVKIKGGENPLGDLFENMIRNADVIMKAGMKNVSMRQSAEVMQAVGLGREVKARDEGKTITYRVDGQNKHFEVDDSILYAALAGAPRHITNGIYKTMAQMAGFFRDMITAAPSFMLANLWRGKVVAYVQEGVPLYANTFNGLRQALKSSTAYKTIAAQTGFGGYTYGMSERDAAKQLEREIGGLGYGPGGLLRRALAPLQKMSEATEMAERIKLYERAKAQGMTDKEAAFQAYLLAPFSRRGMGGGWAGESVNFLVPLVPFLNAKIQGMYRLIENEKGDKQKLWTLGIPKQMLQIFLRGLVVMAASLALAAKNMDDDPERWDNENPDLKFRYDILYTPDGGRILWPRAFEIGSVFGALPVFILDALRRNDSRDLGKVLTDIGTSTFFFNPIPAAMIPILGATTNYDFFRSRALETANDRGKLPEERVNANTSAVARVIGETAGISPIRIQYVLEGYSGTIGSSVLAGLDSIFAGMGLIPNKPAGAFGDPTSMPAIIAGLTGASRFYRSDDQAGSRFVSDFYKIKEITDQLVRSRTMATEGRDLERLEELRGDAGIPLRIRSLVNQTSTQITEINKRIARIERGDLDSVSKREAIRPLRERRDVLARRVVERAREIGAY